MHQVGVVRVGGVASCSSKGVSALPNLYEVVAYGYAHGKLTVGVGGDGFAILGTDLPVHIDVAALHRVVGIGIAHRTTHREGRDVLEVNAVVYQRRGADVA